MRFYVATCLANAPAAQTLASILQDKIPGSFPTYRWWQHGAVWRDGLGRIRDVATKELDAVKNADVFVAILPGGRGTHVEIGAALALGIPVLLVKPVDGGPPWDGEEGTTAFYRHPGVFGRIVTDDLDEAAEKIAMWCRMKTAVDEAGDRPHAGIYHVTHLTEVHPSDCQSCEEGSDPCPSHRTDYRYWEARALDAEDASR